MRGHPSDLALGLVLIGTLATAGPAAAQEHSRGIGLALRTSTLLAGPGDVYSLFAPTLYFTGVSDDRFMFEPSVSFVTTREEVDSEFADYTETLSFIRLGLGFLFLSESGPSGRVYWGPRASITWLSTSTESGGSEEDDSSTDFGLALVTGGEYFLVPRFGLGGEIGVQYTRFGEPENTGGADISRASFGTVAELRVRWYFR